MNTGNVEFVQNKTPSASDIKNNKLFSLPLNGQKDLEDQLQLFKNTCETYEKHQSKRRKRRYYSLGLMAKVERKTTQVEIIRLLKNNTRTFLVDLVTHKFNEVESLIGLIRQAENEQQSEEPNNKLVIGMVLQITGDACQIGRVRNNCSLFLDKQDTITLTTNMAYRYSCFKEIAFAINLHHYLPYIKLNDEISIGYEVRGVVIKKLSTAITILVDKVGIVNSYDLIELPPMSYKLQSTALEEMFCKDLEMAAKLQIDFIALPHVRCLPFLKLLKQKIKTNYTLKLIGSIDLDYISRNMLDTTSIIKHLDCLWLTDLFSSNQTLNTILAQDVIPTAKCLKKPIIGSVPLECCNEFKIFENHEFLGKIDCMFIEKSAWCNKYPIIVKKLLPIKNYRLAIVENTVTMHEILSNTQSIVNFVIRTISSIECKAIFLHSKCATAAKELSRVEIYCPVYVMLRLEVHSQDNMDEYNAMIELTKNLNLRRNLKPVLYTNEMNECKYKPIDYGIEYARNCGCLETGDFIITLEVGKENGDEHVVLGVNEDTVLMRAIYVPPQSIGDKFKCT